MRIAVHVTGPVVRGSEGQVLLLVEGLLARGHDVVVACPAGSAVREAFERVGARSSAVRPRGDLDVVSLFRFTRWLRRERPDAVLETSWKRAFSTMLAARIAGVPRTVLRLGLPQGNIERWKYRQALTRLTDALFVNSAGLRQLLHERAPWLPEQRVHVIVNGVKAVSASPASLRAELSLADDAPLVAAVGGLEHRKGFDILLDAFAAVGDRTAHLVIAGSGPDHASLGHRAAALRIADRVHLLGQRTDVPSVLAASDLYVLSSRREGMAVAMLEAMSAGIPVIATDVHGAWDALAPRQGRGAAGWIVPIADAKALARTMELVLSALREDRREVVARVSEARWRVANWHSPARVAAEVEQLLRA